MNSNFEVIGLTQLEMKPESTAPQEDAPSTPPSEQLKLNQLRSLLTFQSMLKNILHENKELIKRFVIAVQNVPGR